MPAYTIEETQRGPYSLLASQSADGHAFGSAYIDDGMSYPPGPSKNLTFSVTRNQVAISSHGSFHVKQRLREITVLGVVSEPQTVFLDGKRVAEWHYVPLKHKLVAQALNIDLNFHVTFEWM